MCWNYGDVLDAMAPVVPPDCLALIQGERIVTWRAFDRRTNRLARRLIDGGAKAGDEVAFYMRNRPEYVESVAACFKARLAHVNVNYRYLADELRYVLHDSDAQTVIFDAEFANIVAQLRRHLPALETWILVGDDTPEPLAQAYDDLVREGNASQLSIKRSPDDLFFLYTGGTTGMPKGVVWRADDMRHAQLLMPMTETAPRDLSEHVAMVVANPSPPCILPAYPMMHGNGIMSSIRAIILRGTMVISESRSFDPHETWRLVDRHGVRRLYIVGDVIGKPLVEALCERSTDYDLSSLDKIISSGVMWSLECKRGLIELIPHVTLLGSLRASEGNTFAISIMDANSEWQTARFQPLPTLKVIAGDGREIEPGSGEIGLLAVTGPQAIGYYKDPEKSTRVFKVIDGVRYIIPGAWCRYEADGTVTFLGRGSVCINSGGEKVYPEEAEEVLKRHSDVEDALVVGVPDARWGEAVTAIVRLRDGSTIDETNLRDYARRSMAGYRAPKRVLVADLIMRGPNGKADYKSAANFARRQLGLEQLKPKPTLQQAIGIGRRSNRLMSRPARRGTKHTKGRRCNHWTEYG